MMCVRVYTVVEFKMQHLTEVKHLIYRYVKLLVQNFTTRWCMLIGQLILCFFQPHSRPLQRPSAGSEMLAKYSFGYITTPVGEIMY
jgi:hypothetical protein